MSSFPPANYPVDIRPLLHLPCGLHSSPPSLTQNWTTLFCSHFQYLRPENSYSFNKPSNTNTRTRTLRHTCLYKCDVDVSKIFYIRRSSRYHLFYQTLKHEYTTRRSWRRQHCTRTTLTPDRSWSPRSSSSSVYHEVNKKGVSRIHAQHYLAPSSVSSNTLYLKLFLVTFQVLNKNTELHSINKDRFIRYLKYPAPYLISKLNTPYSALFQALSQSSTSQQPSST